MCVEEIHVLHFLTILFEPVVYFRLAELFKNLNLMKLGSRYSHTPLVFMSKLQVRVTVHH